MFKATTMETSGDIDNQYTNMQVESFYKSSYIRRDVKSFRA